ncbi:anti-repressor Ant [Bacillus phage PBC4]|uniref:Putative regulatory protein n=1 Tax=Bacillus phage PBC4 TaxID=1675028 RepID=A0A1I7NZN6_9CAUD|nr:anti-repressor Ant [Bacillus phage PBC4]AKQ08258.1 putative regulatory protein [Bacillus phage PBC4]
MSNIVFIENNEVVTDSLKVSEVFGKRHDNVIQAIENILEMEENAKEYFKECDYINVHATGINKNRKYKKYDLTKEGFTLLVMGFTGSEAMKFKMMYMNEFNRMEQELKNRNSSSYMIEDPIERAKQWIREQEKFKLLEVQNKELSEKVIEAKPKLDLYDAWLDVDGFIKIGDFGKRVGVGYVKIFEKLREMGILMSNKNDWNIPYSRYMKYFVIRDVPKNNINCRVTFLNKDGIVWLHKKLQREKELLQQLPDSYKKEKLSISYDKDANVEKIEVGNKATEWVKQPEEDDYVKDQKIDL